MYRTNIAAIALAFCASSFGGPTTTLPEGLIKYEDLCVRRDTEAYEYVARFRIGQKAGDFVELPKASIASLIHFAADIRKIAEPGGEGRADSVITAQAIEFFKGLNAIDIQERTKSPIAQCPSTKPRLTS